MKEQAKLLRSNGYTLTEISQQLGAIPKNTIQGWVADIALTAHQRARIPLAKFYRSKPDARTLNKPTRRANYHGVCMIYYMSADLQLELQLIGESIMEGSGGAEGDRTPDLQTASLSLSLAELLPRNANSITV